MHKFVLAAALALATLPAVAADAAGDLLPGTMLGTTPESITASLTAMGWELRKLDTEDGAIEAYAVKGAQMAEIHVDPATGAVVKIGNDG